ncbi:hypothetical protein CM15mP5_1020 [bacterium]|nr:MAG: hypothetical protein CM15mP5_1020 [bacterium]
MNEGKAITAFEPDNIEYYAQSAYVRNCTNFVTNSIGMKIDGNKSLEVHLRVWLLTPLLNIILMV